MTTDTEIKDIRKGLTSGQCRLSISVTAAVSLAKKLKAEFEGDKIDLAMKCIRLNLKMIRAEVVRLKKRAEKKQ